MRATRIGTALASVIFVITAGCGDDDGTGPSRPSLRISDLVGTWEATGITVTNGNDPSESVDVIALGAEVNVKFDATRHMAFVSSFKGEIDASTGLVTIGEGSLFIAGDGTQASRTLGCGYENDCLEVTYDADAYDFDSDGVDDPARVAMILERCGDEFDVSDAYGDWTATKWVLTNSAAPFETVDLVALGSSATVTIGADGRYTLRVTPTGQPMETQTGSLRSVGAYLVALDDGDPGSPTAFAWDLGTMTMTLRRTDFEYDFNHDGTEESASAVVECVRR